MGKFDTKVNVDRQDELGTLAVAFNSMADEIQRAKANLEKSVAERTNQLNAANQDLEKQSRELSKRNQEITLFGKMNDFLHASASEAEAYSVISQAATQLFPEESGALFIISASRNMLEAVMVWGSTPPTNVVFPPNECWALRRGQGHIVIDEELRCQHVADDRRMYICLPLIAHGETLGILHILNGPFGTGQAGEQHMADKYRLAKNLAENVGMAIANLKLREAMRSMSIRDPLTGLFNRRYMEEVLAQELHRAKRQVTQLAIIMIDIDHFKQFNDNFGHDGGDAILRELGIFLKKQVRASDVPCRYGGEEFILILSPTTAEGARKRAEQIREDVKLLSVSHAHQKLGTITLSLGIAFYPDHASDSEALVKAADIALYLAKQGGRDQVVVYTKKTDQTTS